MRLWSLSPFPRAAITKGHEVGDLNNRNLKSKVQCQQGRTPSRGSRGDSCLVSCSFWWPRALLGF